MIEISHLTLSYFIENLIYWQFFSFFSNIIKERINVYTSFILIIVVSIALINLKNIEISVKLYEN